MKQHKPQLTVEQCRVGYWDACAEYEATRQDAYSSYAQIKTAADAVARWRRDWIKATERYNRRNAPECADFKSAARSVCAETGEDVAWVLNTAKRA